MMKSFEQRDAEFRELQKKYPSKDAEGCEINGYLISIWPGTITKLHALVRDNNKNVIFRICEEDPEILSDKLDAFLIENNIIGDK